MASAYSLASNDTVLHRPIVLSFDLDEALTLSPNNSAPDDSGHEKIKSTQTNGDLIVSHLPTVARRDVCSICMEDFQPAFPGKQVPCGHVFHAKCVATWISRCDSCPLCRSRCIISGNN